MDIETSLKWQREITGIQRYHDAGFTGKGITVLCHEDTDHGKMAMRVLKQIAPEATVIFANVSQKIKGGKLTEYKWTIDGSTYSFDEVMERFKPDIISCSLKSRTDCTERDAVIQPYIDNGSLIMVTCAGNDGTEGVFPMYHNGLVIGACQFYNGKDDIRNAPYSGRTKGELDISYVGFTYDWDGTSAATPFVAGQIALFMSRFGKVSQAEFQKIIKPHCKDLGDSGKDWIYGDGIIVLPEELEVPDMAKFKDVPDSRWDAEYINWASDKGIVNGFEDGTFKPDETVTRGQMCKMLYEYDKQKGKEE